MARLAFAWLLIAAATVAQAQSVCTITASASRNDVNVQGSGQLAHLRVLATGGEVDIFDAAGGTVETNPNTPAYACATSTLPSVPRFTSGIVNSGGTNNRAILGVNWTFTYADGSQLTRVGTTVFFRPGSSSGDRSLAGSGTLVTTTAQMQYPAGTYSGTIDFGQGPFLPAGRDTNNTYDIIVTVVPAPTISGIAPTSGPTTGGSVTITGTGFTASNSVTFGGTPGTVTAQSATSITVTPPNRAPGSVSVVVTTSQGDSVTSGTNYTYLAAPTVTATAPASGPAAGQNSVVITGTGFTGATSVLFGATAAVGFTVNSATQITAVAPAGTGTVGIGVVAPGGTATLANGYTYTNPPTIGTVAPAAGPTAGTTSVVITGTNLTGATAVTFGGTPATSFTVNSATQITATTPPGTAGAVPVAVTTPGGTATLANGYTYAAAPTVTTVAPNAGPIAGATAVTITGTNFTGATAVTFGGVGATGIVVTDSTHIAATTPNAPGSAPGAVAVAVTTPGGTGTLAGGFTYAAAPTVAARSVSTGYGQSAPSICRHRSPAAIPWSISCPGRRTAR